jgi:hypothetical protein
MGSPIVGILVLPTEALKGSIEKIGPVTIQRRTSRCGTLADCSFSRLSLIDLPSLSG